MTLLISLADGFKGNEVEGEKKTEDPRAGSCHM